MTRMTRVVVGIAVLSLLAIGVSSGPLSDQPTEDEAKAAFLMAKTPRNTSPEVSEPELTNLVSGHQRFVFNLYERLRTKKDNILFSPYSISLTMAMAYAGARHETEQQMANVLHFPLPNARLHPVFNLLDLKLPDRGPLDLNLEAGGLAPGARGQDQARLQLNIANALWSQLGYPVRREFLDVLAGHYGAGLRRVDFKSDPTGARREINDWVRQQTGSHIEKLFPSGTISAATQLVLANAVHFNADWKHQFAAEATQPGSFQLPNGDSVSVPMMSQEAWFGYARGARYQAIELPYVGEMSMVILLPDADHFEDVEATLGAAQMATILNDLEQKEIELHMPKFTFDVSVDLASTLSDMGMPAVFSAKADFSGLTDGPERLQVSSVPHKAVVSIDETGTEASAATGATWVPLSVSSPPEVTIDRPFLFMIRHTETGVILFMGRMIHPKT